jgi:hypothetical protein
MFSHSYSATLQLLGNKINVTLGDQPTRDMPVVKICTNANYNADLVFRTLISANLHRSRFALDGLSELKMGRDKSSVKLHGPLVLGEIPEYF